MTGTGLCRQIWLKCVAVCTVALVLRHALVVFAASPLELQDTSVSSSQGWSIDTSGDLAIVGAPYDSGGYALVYNIKTGEQLYKLRGNDTVLNDHFGYSVAIDGNRAIVGARGDDSARGSAYVFDLSTGQQIRKLTSPNRISNTQFGLSVDISGDLAVVSTPFNRSTESHVGSQFGSLFTYNIQTGETLYQLDGEVGDDFYGMSVALEGDTLVRGEPASFGQSRIHVFDAFTGQMRWSYGYPEGGARFDPKDVEIDGDLIAVGLGSGLYDMPEVVVLDRVAGTLINHIDTRLGSEGDGYKRDVDLSGNRVVVGSWGTSHPGIDGPFVGEATVFDAFTDAVIANWRSPHPESFGEFGYAVGIEGDHVLVAAPGEDSNQGIVYSYVIPEPATIWLSVFSLFAIKAARPRRQIEADPRNWRC